MKKNISSLFENLKDIKMTEEEKKSTWDGVLRRAADYPGGNTPYAGDPASWDGVLRRKSDFPQGVVLPFNTEKSKQTNDETVRNDEAKRLNTRGLPALSNLSALSQNGNAALLILAGVIILIVLFVILAM